MTGSPEDRWQGRVGSVIKEKWRIDAILSAGAMAAVYAATHRNGNRGVLKILHLHLSRDADLRGRFLREAYFANLVSHDGVVKVLDDDITEDGAAFLVMELLDGESLDERRQRAGGTLSVVDLLAIFDPLLEIVAAAHDKGVIHRDLKPENVFLTRRGEVKVLDFGFARIWDAARSSEVTEAGMVLGSPSYMAPEQARGSGEEIDGRADIWSLGATMFMLLAGVPVHPHESLSAKIRATGTTPPRSLRDAAPSLPRAVVSVVDRALAFDKADRWQDARSMREALRWARRGLGGEAAAERVSALDRALRPEAQGAHEDPTAVLTLPALEETREVTVPAELLEDPTVLDAEWSPDETLRTATAEHPGPPESRDEPTLVMDPSGAPMETAAAPGDGGPPAPPPGEPQLAQAVPAQPAPVQHAPQPAPVQPAPVQHAPARSGGRRSAMLVLIAAVLGATVVLALVRFRRNDVAASAPPSAPSTTAEPASSIAAAAPAEAPSPATPTAEPAQVQATAAPSVEPDAHLAIASAAPVPRKPPTPPPPAEPRPPVVPESTGPSPLVVAATADAGSRATTTSSRDAGHPSFPTPIPPAASEEEP